MMAPNKIYQSDEAKALDDIYDVLRTILAAYRPSPISLENTAAAEEAGRLFNLLEKLIESLKDFAVIAEYSNNRFTKYTQAYPRIISLINLLCQFGYPDSKKWQPAISDSNTAKICLGLLSFWLCFYLQKTTRTLFLSNHKNLLHEEIKLNAEQLVRANDQGLIKREDLQVIHDIIHAAIDENSENEANFRIDNHSFSADILQLLEKLHLPPETLKDAADSSNSPLTIPVQQQVTIAEGVKSSALDGTVAAEGISCSETEGVRGTGMSCDASGRPERDREVPEEVLPNPPEKENPVISTLINWLKVFYEHLAKLADLITKFIHNSFKTPESTREDEPPSEIVDEERNSETNQETTPLLIANDDNPVVINFTSHVSSVNKGYSRFFTKMLLLFTVVSLSVALMFTPFIPFVKNGEPPSPFIPFAPTAS